MELVREIVPFLVGVLLPIALLLFMRSSWPSYLKFLLTFALAAILGTLASFVSGRLRGEPPAALASVLVDTSLVFTGSQLAYHLFWKPLLEIFNRRKPAYAKQAVPPRR